MEYVNTAKERLLVLDAAVITPKGTYDLSALALLMVTILLETAGTLLLKYSLEDNRIYVIAFICYFTSLGLFSYVLRTIPLYIAYTTWCALGIIMVCVFSSILFGEPIRPLKWVAILMTIPCISALYVM